MAEVPTINKRSCVSVHQQTAEAIRSQARHHGTTANSIIVASMLAFEKLSDDKQAALIREAQK